MKIELIIKCLLGVVFPKVNVSHIIEELKLLSNLGLNGHVNYKAVSVTQ